MGEGGFRPESTGEIDTSRVGELTPKYERRPEREDRTSPELLIVDISESDLQESQSNFAVGRGFESFDEMPPNERAEYWAIESGVRNNYLRAETAAKEAGLDRKQQLEYEIKALEARMGALARFGYKGHIKEFYSLDEIGTTLRQELKDLK